MDQEVARTLAQLELKLRELERELVSLGGQPTPAATHPYASASPAAAPEPPAPLPPPAPAPERWAPQPQPVGRLVDEVVERRPVGRYSMEAQETAFGEIPATRDEQGPVDPGELIRFGDTLRRTLQGLIDEYDRLLARARRQ